MYYAQAVFKLELPFDIQVVCATMLPSFQYLAQAFESETTEKAKKKKHKTSHDAGDSESD